MAIILSDVSNALQKIIKPYIVDNFPKQTILLDQVKRNTNTTYMNNYFYATLRTSRHGGVAPLADDGNKLTSGKASLGQAYVGVKLYTGTFDISKLAIDATKSAKGAVENQLTFQATTLASDFARSVNRQYFGDGSGVISQVASSVSASAFTVCLPDANGIAAEGRLHDRYGTINGDIDPAEYIYPDQVIVVGSAGSIGTVSSVAGGTVTCTGACTPVANDPVYVVDADGEGAGTAEIEGLGAALNSDTGTSTYANVARSTYSWTPTFGSTSETLTLSRMEEGYLAARKYGNLQDRYAIFVNKSLYKKYGDILSSMRRSTSMTENLLGGWPGLEFQVGGGRIGVFLDYDVPDGEVLIVNLDSLTICQVSELGWMEDASEGAMQRRPDYITYQSTMYWFTNLLCTCPGASAKYTRKTD